LIGEFPAEQARQRACAVCVYVSGISPVSRFILFYFIFFFWHHPGQ
jgi:hypothetical protein